MNTVTSTDDLYASSTDYVCDSRHMGSCGDCKQDTTSHSTCIAYCADSDSICQRNNMLDEIKFSYTMCLQHFSEHLRRHYHHSAHVYLIFHDKNQTFIITGQTKSGHFSSFGGFFDAWHDTSLIDTASRELVEETRGVFGNQQQIKAAFQTHGRGIFFKQTLAILLDVRPLLQNNTMQEIHAKIPAFSYVGNPDFPCYDAIMPLLVGPNIDPEVAVDDEMTNLVILPVDMFGTLTSVRNVVQNNWNSVATLLDANTMEFKKDIQQLPFLDTTLEPPLNTNHGAIIFAKFTHGLSSAVNFPDNARVDVPPEVDTLFGIERPFMMTFEEIISSIKNTLGNNIITIVPKGAILFHMSNVVIESFGAGTFFAQAPELSLSIFGVYPDMPKMLVAMVTKKMKILNLCAFEKYDIFFKEIVRVLLGRQLWHRSLRAAETFDQHMMVAENIFFQEDDRHEYDRNREAFTKTKVHNARVISALAYMLGLDGWQAIDRLDAVHVSNIINPEFAIEKTNPFSVMSYDASELRWYREVVITNPNRLHKLASITIPQNLTFEKIVLHVIQETYEHTLQFVAQIIQEIEELSDLTKILDTDSKKFIDLYNVIKNNPDDLSVNEREEMRKSRQRELRNKKRWLAIGNATIKYIDNNFD